MSMFSNFKTTLPEVERPFTSTTSIHQSFSLDLPLNEADFWHLLNFVDFKNYPKASIRPLVEQLKQGSIANIRAFQDMLMEKLQALDQKKYTLHIGKSAYQTNRYFSTTHFLHVRTAVIAQGKNYYEKVLAEPATMPDNSTFESLLYAAAIAYEEKTGKVFIYNSLQNTQYSKKKNWRSQQASRFSCI